MSREVKIGLLAVIAIASGVFGYRFVKGENLFQSSKELVATFDNVAGLAVSSDVSVNGYKVGNVTSIKMNPQNVNQMKVSFRINGDVPVPKSAKVQLTSEGLVGGKFLSLSFDKMCSGGDCAVDGDVIEGETLGLVGSMIGTEDIGAYVGDAAGELNKVIANLGSESGEGKVNEIIIGLDATLDNITKLTASLDQLTRSSSRAMQQTFKNLEQITGNLAKNNDQITSMLSNLEKTTNDLSKADFAGTMTSANTMLTNSNETVTKLQTTLQETNKAVSQFGQVASKFNEGDGSLSKLLNDKALYTNLTSTSDNLALLLQDMRLNPRRYVHLSVFGKKDKEYVKPEDDPANK